MMFERCTQFTHPMICPQVKVMEIFDVTQTDPSLLVSDSMGIQYSMDDQVSNLVKFLLIVKICFARCCRTTAYLVCATLPALPRSPQSLGATRSRASASPPHPGTSPPPPRFKRCPKRQNGQLLQAFASHQKSFLRYLGGLLVSYNTSDL